MDGESGGRQNHRRRYEHRTPVIYEHRLAYRFPETRKIEGFLGTGFTKQAAREDAIKQIKRKIEILIDHERPKGSYASTPAPRFSPSNIIEKTNLLTHAELKTAQADWNSGLRY